MLESADAWCLATIIAFGAFCVFWRLGDQTLRLDEARTALLAENVLRFGVPVIFDGRRPPCFSLREADDRGRFILHTWLQFYVVAASFAALGRGAAAARAPMALAGLFVVSAVYAAGSGLGGPRVAVLSALFVATCVSFVLLARQARHYAPALLLESIVLAIVVHGAGWSAAPVLGAVLVLLFYTEWVLWLALVPAIVLYAATFSPETLAPTAAACAVSWALALPWQAYLLRVAGGPFPVPPGEVGRVGPRELAAIFSRSFWRYFWKCQVYFFPAGVVAGALYAGCVATGTPLPRAPDGLWLMIVTALSVVASKCFTRVSFTRYVAGAIPPLALATGWGASGCVDVYGAAGWALVALCTGTNVLHLLPYHAFRLLRALGVPRGAVPFLVPPQRVFTVGPSLAAYVEHRARPCSRILRYLQGLGRHYPTRCEAIVRYLRDHAGPDDVVLADHQEAPTLSFHTGLRVIPYRGPRRGETLDEVTGLGWDDVRWVVPGGLFPPDSDPRFAERRGAFELHLLAGAADVYLDNGDTLDRYHFARVAIGDGVPLFERIARDGERRSAAGRVPDGRREPSPSHGGGSSE